MLLSALPIFQCAVGYMGSLRNPVALEQFIPLSCGWVGYLFMDSLPLTLTQLCEFKILMTLRTCCTPSDLSYRVYLVLFCVILLTLTQLTLFWQHRIGPQFAFPQQLLQLTNIQLTSSYISFYKDQ